MLAHAHNSGHPVAAGVRDLSVWCFQCDEYLDTLRIPELARTFEALHQEKFGEEVSGFLSMASGSGLGASASASNLSEAAPEDRDVQAGPAEPSGPDSKVSQG